MDSIRSLVVSAMVLSLATPVLAIETDLPVKINGFGTIAAVHNDNEDVSFYGANDETDWDADSVMGLQAKVPLADKLDLTAQAIARGYENYDLKMEWLFLTYELADQLDARAGRLRIPFFMFSDSLEVGYSYPWIRPPVDVYGQLGFNTFDGVDALYSMDFSSMRLELQPYVGSGRHDIIRPGDNGELQITNLWGLHAVLGNESISLHAGHTEGDFDIKEITAIDGFLMGLNAFGYPSVAKQFGTDNRHGTFDGIGVDATWNNVRFISEYTRKATDGLIPNSAGWYATLAYQLGDFTPHVTFSELDNEEDYGGEMMAATSMPPPLAMGTQAFVHQNTVSQKSFTAGLRWDILKQTAVKFEWQRINPDNHGSPSFQVVNPFYPGDPVNIYSVGLDFVF